MEKVISVSVGELALKGLNRKFFEDKLISQIKGATKDLGAPSIYKEQGKFYIEGEEKYYDQIINRVKKIFGIVYLSPCIKVGKNMSEIKEGSICTLRKVLDNKNINTFKVETNRVDKSFPLESPKVSREIGGLILGKFQNLTVDVHNPNIYLYIDIKENCYIYTEKIKGYGGLPVGTNGEGLLLLSGGIDSPVAGFLMAKRGIKIHAVHYHSYPFTGKRSEEKVKALAKILSMYTGEITIYSVNILEVQKEINEKCPSKEMTILSRRFMMRIAEEIALKHNINGLITGESLGQVASQTIEGVGVTNASVTLPVLRPLIGFDKVDIIDIARDIETYETSILPYDDCCTLFLPKHPVTKPRLKDIEKSEEKLDVEGLVEKALDTMKVIKIIP